MVYSRKAILSRQEEGRLYRLVLSCLDSATSGTAEDQLVNALRLLRGHVAPAV